MGTDVIQVGVLPGNLSKYLQEFYPGELPAFLSELTQDPLPTRASTPIKQRLEQTSEEEHEGILIEFIRDGLANVLRISPSQLDVRKPLNTMVLDSLMAVELRDRIRSGLDVDIPMAKFMENISVFDLVQQIQTRLIGVQATTSNKTEVACTEDTWAPRILLPFRTITGDHKPPLFYIHPVGGGVLGYRDLADCLPEDQPVYGIQAVGFEGEEVPLTNIESMAMRYVEEITRLWPGGPYNLYGLSFGGMVAFEMAHLLWVEKQEITLLTLGDTVTLSQSEDQPEEPGEDEIMLHILMEAGGEKALSSSEFQDLRLADRLAYLRKQFMGKSDLAGSQDLSHFIRIHPANLQSVPFPYWPSPWEGPLVFLAAAESKPVFGLSVNPGMWERLAKQVYHYVVPGNHFTMHRQPNVRRIAEILGKYLELS